MWYRTLMGAGVGGATSRSSLILLAGGISSSHVVVSRDCLNILVTWRLPPPWESGSSESKAEALCLSWLSLPRSLLLFHVVLVHPIQCGRNDSLYQHQEAGIVGIVGRHLGSCSISFFGPFSILQEGTSRFSFCPTAKRVLAGGAT